VQLLYITKQERPGLEIAIRWLCTRVTNSDEGDWKKLRRVLAYVKYTIYVAKIIGASSLQEIYIWVDAGYTVNSDMKSQTGGAMLMGCGVIYCKSGKQKIHVKISTEAELVEVRE